MVVENPYEVGHVEGEVWATLVDAQGRDTGAPGLVSSRVGEGGLSTWRAIPCSIIASPDMNPWSSFQTIRVAWSGM